MDLLIKQLVDEGKEFKKSIPSNLQSSVLKTNISNFIDILSKNLEEDLVEEAVISFTNVILFSLNFNKKLSLNNYNKFLEICDISFDEGYEYVAFKMNNINKKPAYFEFKEKIINKISSKALDYLYTILSYLNSSKEFIKFFVYVFSYKKV